MGPGAPPSRQNVQIGSGMDYNQSVTQRFSPEMMQMLPPNMQQPLANHAPYGSTPSAPPASSTWQTTQSNAGFGTRGLGWGRNTVTSQSSTVVLPQGGSVTTTEERYIPGYTAPYGLPYSTTTTVPYGTPYGAPYIAPAAPMISTPLVGGGGMGAPMYGSSTTTTQLGTPTYSPSGTPPASQLQAIASLENRLYGRAQPSQMSATYRLQVMEQGLLGQTYDSLPTDQRIQQLQQAASQTNLALPAPKKRGLLGTLADTVSTALSGGYGTVQPVYGYGYGDPYATTNAPNSVIYPGYYYGTGLPQPAANAWGY
jgi:hypothetical protein